MKITMMKTVKSAYDVGLDVVHRGALQLGRAGARPRTASATWRAHRAALEHRDAGDGRARRAS